MRKYLHDMVKWQIEVSSCLKTQLFFSLCKVSGSGEDWKLAEGGKRSLMLQMPRSVSSSDAL